MIKIFTKLNAEPKKVELSIADDLLREIEDGLDKNARFNKLARDTKRKLEQYFKIADDLTSMKKELANDLEGIEFLQNSMQVSLNRANKDWLRVSDAVKELGIEMPKGIGSKYRKLEVVVKESKNTKPSNVDLNLNL